jgi:osmotically-inducible protein OsmY
MSIFKKPDRKVFFIALGLVCAAPILTINAKSMTETVKESTADSYITSKIKSKLALDKSTKSLKIHITTEKGIVYLSGHVDSINEILEAVKVSAATKGVVDIESSALKLMNDVMLPSDQVMAAKITGFLAKDSLLTEDYDVLSHLTVTVQNGIATLSGVVKTPSQRNKAVDIALHTRGIKKVVSHIQISTLIPNAGNAIYY